MIRKTSGFITYLCFPALGMVLAASAGMLSAQPPAVPATSNNTSDADCASSVISSPFIPVDSWIYPAVLRLYSLGYVDTAYLGMRPWTRASLKNMLEYSASDLEDTGEDTNQNAASRAEATEIYRTLTREIERDNQANCLGQNGLARLDSSYTTFRGISGTPLHDSFHLGSTVINDYGRPYENGFDNYTGASGYAATGRFLFFVRGEFQGSPSGTGYSASLAEALSTVDGVAYANSLGTPYSQPTIPAGPIASLTRARVVEAYVSAQFLNHVFSFGKQDEWLGPGQGGAMAYSNNAENIYAFHINRVEPLRIPGLSRFTGPFRYEFLVGALQGHTYMPNPEYQANPSPSLPNVMNPGNPWVHVEKISFKPTPNLEFGFERTALWGGKGHQPITFHTFFKSFFSATNASDTEKFGRDDPGARFGAFDASYRLPSLRNWLTLYWDSDVHDDVSPTDAPHRSIIRPGIYLSHFPRLPRLDMRLEAASSDPVSSTPGAREYGHFMYWETIERQGYTNQGQLFGDWIGREDKGGQAWLTWHLSGNEWIQASYRNQKATKDFIPGSTTETIPASTHECLLSTPCLAPGGTTLNDFGLQIVKRIGKDVEVNGNFTLEQWKVPVYSSSRQTVTNTTIQVTWFPSREVSF
jgi:hypothetical protein